jgi:site-specific recombinase XerD
MIRIKRRGKIWWMEIHHNGQRDRYSLKTRDREVADDLRRQKELDLLSGGRLGQRQWLSFKDEYLGWAEPHLRASTMKRYREIVESFSRFLSAERIVKLDHVTSAVISRYCAMRADPKMLPARVPGRATRRALSPGGLRFELRVLRRVCSYSVRAGYLSRNPVSGFGNLAADAGRTQPFTQAEVTAMLDFSRTDKRMTAILNVFLHTGLRLSDVIALEKTSIVGDRWEVKTRKRSRWVRPLVHPELRRIIESWQQTQNEQQIASELLFTTESGGRMKYMDQELRRLWKRAGIHHGHAHRFRDTFATRALEMGWTLDDVARALGIGEAVVARHYAPFTPRQQDRQDQMIRSLDFTLQRKLPIQ